MISKFIVVDDDKTNNILCRLIIKRVLPAVDINTYTDPETALDYIKSKLTEAAGSFIVLFLDINMPTINGWEFLDFFEKFDEAIKRQIKIYMLSSSVDDRDRERAEMNKNVAEFINKPLTRSNVEIIAESF